MVRAEFKLAGQVIPPPELWQGVKVLSRFDNDAVEANTEVEAFDFVNEGAWMIQQWIEDGKNGSGPGIFEGIPFSITLTDAVNGDLNIFDGFVNLAEGFEVISPNKCRAKISRLDTLNDINSKLEAITYGLLVAKGPILGIGPADYTDVRYVVEKEFNGAEFATLSITVFLLTREIIDITRNTAKDTANVIAMFAGGALGRGQIASAALAIALIAINLAYAVIMIKLLLQLFDELLTYLFPPVQVHKGMTLRKALEKAFGFLEYTFSSSIPELDLYVYTPSKPEGSPRIEEGIPNSQDYGYRVIEMIDLVKMLFLAKLRIDQNAKEVRLLALNDSFWLQQTAFQAPDVLNEGKKYNTQDLASTHLISFATDPQDFWTIQNYRGTSYEVTTEAITQQAPENSALRGLRETRFPIALASRKDGLTDLEETIAKVAKVMDKVIHLFGGNSNLEAKITNRVGLMKQGSRYHNIPKLVYLVNGVVPADYRDKLSAKYLYDTYINYNSFVTGKLGGLTVQWLGQKQVVTDQKMPFTFANFLLASQNKFFKLHDGRDAEFTKIEWLFDADTATVSYKIRESYTFNLKETTVEAA